MPKLRRVKIADIKPDENNANIGTKRGRELLESSLKKYGMGRSILVDKNNRVIAGNATLRAASQNGHKKIRVIPTTGDELVVVQRTDLDLNSKKARELAIADNRTSELNLEWNPEVLATLDVDLSQFWNEGEMRKLVPQVTIETPEPRFDKAAQLQKKWKTVRGQMWEVGNHRLMCGDSASDDVAKLFGNKKAWLINTDPPYGVGFGVSSGPDSARRFTAISGDEDNGPKLQTFLESVFTRALPFLNKGAAWYLWHAQMTQGFFAAAAAAAAQVKIHRQIIWAKSHFVLGHGDFHWQHELCFYGWREGEKHRWFGDRSQSTVWAIDNPRIHENHPTEKPVEIFTRPMQFNTEPGDICYEPFAGSGSQFCAAQITDRACFGLELEPQYAAVALERLSEMGLKPKLLTKR